MNRGQMVCIAVLASLLAAPATAQLDSGAQIAVVATHPHPDSADPLGFEYSRGVDVHQIRYGPTAEGVLQFPHVAVDGIWTLNGLPEGSDTGNPEELTTNAIRSAVQQRLAEPTPVSLQLQSRLLQNGSLSATLKIAGDEPAAAKVAWFTVLEDNVNFRPPERLSNGVYNHRFTLRDVATAPIIDNSSAIIFTQFDVERIDQLLVTAWVQGDGTDARFGAGEVLQAVTDKPGGNATLQSKRAVLVEMRTATWCDTCLFGDRAVEELAVELQLVSASEISSGPKYALAPSNLILTMLGAIGGMYVIAKARSKP